MLSSRNWLERLLDPASRRIHCGGRVTGELPRLAKLPASDIDRAVKFYAERLGLTPASHLPGHFFYECAATQFLLFRSRGHASGTHDQMGWYVADIEVQTLKSRGVHFETFDYPGNRWDGEIADNGFRRSAWFRDSEGNLLNVIQLLDSK